MCRTLNWASGGPTMITILCLASMPSAGAIWKNTRCINQQHSMLSQLVAGLSKSQRNHRFSTCLSLTLIDAPAKCESCLICCPCFPMMAPTARAGMKRWTVSDSGCPCEAKTTWYYSNQENQIRQPQAIWLSSSNSYAIAEVDRAEVVLFFKALKIQAQN